MGYGWSNDDHKPPETEVEQALREAAENGTHAIEGANRDMRHALNRIRNLALEVRTPISTQVLRIIDEVLP